MVSDTFTMPERIEGERIVLVRPYPVTMELATEMFGYVEASRDSLQEWLSWVSYTQTPEDEYQHWLIDWCLKGWEAGTGFAYMMRDKQTNQFLGVVELFRLDKQNRWAEFGYWLSEEACGHGYVREALLILERMAFEQGLNRLVIRNDVENIRSIHVAERLGYHLDGVMRAEEWSPYWNMYRDKNVWSKLKSEWETEQKK